MCIEHFTSLPKARRGSNGRWTACCPCPSHPDKNPSLSFYQEPSGRVVFNCFAKCDAGEIVAAMGLTWEEVNPDYIPRPKTPAERREWARQRGKLKAQRAAQAREAAQKELDGYLAASKEAQALWAASAPCTGHSYLEAKKVQPHGLRVGTWTARVRGRQVMVPDTLLVPARDSSGYLWSLQGIFPVGHSVIKDLGRNKDNFLYGRMGGCCHWMGSDTSTIFICEGYATACSVHAHMGGRAFVTFTCGNLKAVGLAIRRRYPSAEIIFCADNDTDKEGNPGVSCAREAARAVGGAVSIPVLLSGGPGDWNDFFNEVSHGSE